MRAFNRWLVSIAVIMFLSNAASAQGASEEISSGDSAAKVFGMSQVGDMVQAASDFRKATEALDPQEWGLINREVSWEDS